MSGLTRNAGFKTNDSTLHLRKGSYSNHHAVDARGAFYQTKQFINEQVPKINAKKNIEPSNWDNRWNVTHSKSNGHRHPFYRQYFDKEPAESAITFQYQFGHNSPDALPGIIDVHHRQPSKSFHKGSAPETDHVTLTKETRMPIEYLTSPKARKMSFAPQATTYPDMTDHVQLATGWEGDHNVTVSNFNRVHHKSQREYFDAPIKVPNKGYSHIRKEKKVPFSVYSGITPMRSAKHCQQLLDTYKRIEL